MTTTMDDVITVLIKIKQKCDRSSNFVVYIKHIYYGGLVGMQPFVDQCCNRWSITLTAVRTLALQNGVYAKSCDT